MRYLICLSLALGLTIASSNSFARDVKIGFTESSKPYVTGDEENPGISVEIAREALSAVGHSVVPVYHSFKRIVEEVRQGRLDGAAGCCGEENTALHYSQPCIVFNNVAIVKQGDGIEINSISDLPGHSIVAWQDAHDHLGGEFQQLFGGHVTESYVDKYFDLPDQMAQVRMFWSGRADIIVIDDLIFDYLTRTLSEELDTTRQLKRHALFGGPTVFSIVFTDPDLRNEFNKGLAIIRENGLYDQIYEKYRAGVSEEARRPARNRTVIQKGERSAN